jgi:hypothetical protein
MTVAAKHADESPTDARGSLGLVLLAAFVLASRLPCISGDYGADPDCYRVVNAARQIAFTSHYVESRLPGYPVQEYALSLLIRGGLTSPATSNGLTALFSVAACLFLALILRSIGLREYVLASAAFALTPVVYISSSCSIDYMWAVAFVLGATYLVLRERPVVAGCLLGLGVGCRITSAAMLPLLGVLLFVTAPPKRRQKKTALFVGTAAIVGLFCFSPVMLRHGLALFTFVEPPEYPPLAGVVSRATTGVWGTLGTMAWIGVASVLATEWFRHRLRTPQRPGVLLLCCIVVLVYAAIYVRLPLESGYLVPMVPFAIIGLGLVAPGRLFRAFCLTVCVAPVLDVGRSGVSVGGPLGNDQAQRQGDHRTAVAVIDAAASLGPGAVVVCGTWQPRILSMLSPTSRDARRYVHLITDRLGFERYAAEGYQVFFVPGAELENRALYQVNLRSLGAQELALRR